MSRKKGTISDFKYTSSNIESKVTHTINMATWPVAKLLKLMKSNEKDLEAIFLKKIPTYLIKHREVELMPSLLTSVLSTRRYSAQKKR